jgi:class 3 adenylate cyclase
MEELTEAELAARAGVSEAAVERLVRAGVLVPREGPAPFRPSDAQKISVATACEEGGLPMEGIADAIRAGRLSFVFLEAWPFRQWNTLTERTHREAAEETGLDLDTAQRVAEAFGFPPAGPEDPISDGEREAVRFMAQGLHAGVVDVPTTLRFGAVYADAMRRAAAAENEIYHSGFEMPLLRAGHDQPQTMRLAAEASARFTEPALRTVIAVYRRQQEVVWTEHLIEHIEQALEDSGVYRRPDRPPAMSFLDLTGYTRLTEELGDEAGARLAATFEDLVRRSGREHHGEPVKWLGDGVMSRFRTSGDAVVSALELVERVPDAGLPPAHVGVAAGPVIRQGGDYFGRTVNLASRISSRAAGGQVLVSESVVETAHAPGVRFRDLGPAELKGLAEPVRLFEAVR